MNYYKGVNLDRNENLYNYINSYHSIDCELREVYMEADKPLQRLVSLHHLKISLYKTAFNLSVYAVFYGIIISIQG